MTSGGDVHAAALAAWDAGLCPLRALLDGSKAPAGQWKRYTASRPTRSTVDKWFAGGYPGLGLVCGAVSGGLEMLELEGRLCVDGWRDELRARAVDAGVLTLVDLIERGYREESPSGGRHYLYRIEGHAVPGNEKIARQVDDAGEVHVLVETRGEGGWVVIAPSHGTTHPTGRPWKRLGGSLETLPTLSWGARQDLHKFLLDVYDRMPTEKRSRKSSRTSEDRSQNPIAIGEGRPGDAFNVRTTWGEVLEPHGWEFVRETGGVGYWRRPGAKTKRHDATTNATGHDTLKVHSTSTSFDTERTYDRFGAWAHLEHGGDLGAAALALAREAAGVDELARRRDRRARKGSGPPPPDVPPSSPSDDGGRRDRPPRRMIQTNDRTLDSVGGEMLETLVQVNDPPVLYVRGGRLVRLTGDELGRPQIELVDARVLQHHASKAADYARMLQAGPRRTFPPREACNWVVHAPSWPLPPLTGITGAPIVRPDASIATRPGYDQSTGLYHWSDVELADVDEHPSKEAVQAALDVLDDVVNDFPFAGLADIANTYALMLTPLVRPLVGCVPPMALLDAPTPGTGKGLLAKLIAVVTTGHVPAMQWLPALQEELEKRLTSVILAGEPIVVWDNIDRPLRDAALAAALTSDPYRGRLLGGNTPDAMPAIPNRATFIATGNNIAVAGDMARRCFRVRLDAGIAHPDRRNGFRHPRLLDHARDNRGKILTALVTLVSAWRAAGCPLDTEAPGMGEATSWVRTIGGILQVAGVPGFLSNADVVSDELDVEGEEWVAWLSTWWGNLQAPVTVAQLESAMNPTSSIYVDALYRLLPGELSSVHGTPRFKKALGYALRKRAGRPHGAHGWQVQRAGQHREGVALWTVKPLTDPGERKPDVEPAQPALAEF